MVSPTALLSDKTRALCLTVENRKIPTDLRDDALKLQQQTDWDDAGGEGTLVHQLRQTIDALLFS